MPGKVKISVIVPCYNQALYIRQCLDSILSQKTSFRYEILVGDDASDDDTPLLLKQYADKYPDIIRVFYHEKNLGPVENAISLFAEAKGEYIAYLEGDDFWYDDNKLQLQSDYLDEHSDMIGCFHPISLADKDGNVIKGRLHWLKYKKVFSFADFDGVRLPGHSSSWLRRNIISSNIAVYREFLSISPIIADRTAALYFLNHGNFGLINKTMGCYRYLRSSGVTGTAYKDRISSLNMEYDFACALKTLTHEALNRPMTFAKTFRMLFAKSLIIRMFDHSDRSKIIFRKIWNAQPNKALAVLTLPINLTCFIIRKILYSE